ncbi:dihydrolipoamide acetyltransferase family protein [Blattabacterium cuenoti]|uniref:dihydrolipoamide acetyltransferase family protein n=1 Tax=Blattabacterium cuenoti TaxID=1653831 RepID=UPI00163B8B7B|nr:dihydrolipoamide acetyltransferase family protein [Blattabacterium cuenoti]
MAEIISMPQLSDTMKEGTVIKWNKKVGDKVSEGDIIAEIETDKAIQDFEIDVSGIILFIGVKEGETTRVNDILAIIGKKGEDIKPIIKQYNEEKNELNEEKNELNKEKNELNEEKNELNEEKNELNEEKNELNEEKNELQRIFISPLAKKMAKRRGISIHKIKGSGDNGRIIKKDIELYDEKKRNNLSLKNEKRIIVTSIRKKIAKHLTFSKFTAPHYYLFQEINVGKIIELRKNLNEKLDIEEKISFNDIIIKAVSISLRKHIYMNISWNDNEIIYHYNINIGVAVAIKDGLIVPVIKNTDEKSLLQISKEIKDKVERSKLRKIKPKELVNSTFTVSNLGMYGIESFTSIINYPNSSILSIGAIIEKPIIKNSNIIIGNMMKITLSCDHRIIDGSTASNFITYLKKILEDPLIILV